MSIFEEIHAVRVVNPGLDHSELLRVLSEAISGGYVEQITVMNSHQYAPNRSWYRDKKTGQIYSLDPPDHLPGWWTEVDPGDRDFTQLRAIEGGTNGSAKQRRTSVKMVWGALLLLLTPVFFVKPVSKATVLRDLLLVIWWAFIIWLLVTGAKESRPTDSK